MEQLLSNPPPVVDGVGGAAALTLPPVVDGVGGAAAAVCQVPGCQQLCSCRELLGRLHGHEALQLCRVPGW